MPTILLSLTPAASYDVVKVEVWDVVDKGALIYVLVIEMLQRNGKLCRAR